MKIKRMRLILFIFFVTNCAQLPKSRQDIRAELKKPLSQQINPFQSDGCSVWPEGSKKNKTSWLRCCLVHDIAYWRGGTKEEKETADAALQSCVERHDSNFIAELMKFGVSIGGTPKYKTSFRWGFGWNYNRGFLPLNSRERSYIEKISPKKGEDLLKYLDKSKIDPEIDHLPPIIF